MSVRLMVLGVLSDNSEVHGYAILRQLNAWKADTWTNIKPGSIYHALVQLEKHGFAKSGHAKASREGSVTTSYKITDTGKHELHSLIEKALVSYDQQEFAAGLAWMHLLTRQEVIGLAKQRLAMHEQTCAFLRTLPRAAQPSNPAEHPEIIESWTALFDTAETWTRAFVLRLENGSYRFSGE